MDKLKQWVVLSIAASVLIVAAGWFLAVSPKRTEAQELRTQAAEQVATNQGLETQLQVLRAKAKDLPKEQAALAAVTAKIPSDPALPGLVRSLLEAAQSSGVELVSVAPSAPELIAAPAAATPAAPPAPAQGQTTPAAPTAPGTPGTAPGGAAAAPGPAGQLAKIPVAITVVGDFFEVQSFMSAVETLPRALRVENLVVAPGLAPTDDDQTSVEDGRRLSTQINGLVYMAADRPVPVAATVPADAAPADAAADAAAPTATTAE